MNHGSHSSMGSVPLPELREFPKFYWAVVGSAVGVATLVNIYNHVLGRQRIHAARAGSPTPAKPRLWFTIWNATIFALIREASNFSLHIPLKGRKVRFPSVGRLILVLANLTTLLVLCSYGLDLNGRFSREDVAFRCGVVTVGQLPLIFLLAGKNNIIGYLSGMSYERLNWLHRWCARTMLLTATIHMGYFLRLWAPYDFIGYKLKNDGISWKGLAAWSTLVWIVFSSMAPIRGWCYELFVIQHLVSFAVLTGFVYIHIPAEMRGYVWVPVALFFLDRTLRALRVVYANLSLFHSKVHKGQSQSLLSCKASFTPLPHNTTRVVIHNPPISWRPGQHVFLSCHSIVPLQSHPFTVASIPEDGIMEFLIKSETGGTRRFLRHAEKTQGLSETAQKGRTVTIEGPYGCIRPLRQFDSIILFAGSTGVTFTLPLLRDIVQGWRENSAAIAENSRFSLFGRQTGAVVRHVRFVWVIKSREQLSWLAEQLSSVSTEFQSLQEKLRDIKLELTVYITCDEAFTEEHRSLISTLTAPKHSNATQDNAGHGKIQYRARPMPTGEERASKKSVIQELTRVATTDTGEQQTCGPNGTCCCRTEVDENTSPDNISKCCCSTPSSKTSEPNPTSRPTSHISSSSPPSLKQKVLIHPSITLYSGRPKTRDIIQRSLEQALGESAVVVCGPQGLVADVKQHVCSLSDERAVHKGTGAQGIYLHTESFNY